MKLKALDQIHISSVQADTIAPGTEFAVSAVLGRELLKKHPDRVELVSDEEPEPETQEEAKMEAPLENKAEPPLSNKAEVAAPADKAIIGAKPKPKGK